MVKIRTMKYHIRSLFCFLIIHFTVLLTTPVRGQMQNWKYVVPVQIIENRGINYSQYQALIHSNFYDAIQNGKMNPDGSDVRFTDSCGTQILKHWIVGELNHPGTAVFVDIGPLAPYERKTILMFYGNTNAISNEDSSFMMSNVWTSGGSNHTAQNFITAGYFELKSGDTLFLSPGMDLTINARMAVINGVIYGNGCGYTSLSSLTCLAAGGSGQFYGLMFMGGGGGGYGGEGGTGNCCYCTNTPTNNGGTGGTTNGGDICVGRSGGGSLINPGGAGGGSISIQADFISNNGKILMSGKPGSGNFDLSTRSCSGGGSGGGILLKCQSLSGTAYMEANGGNGGNHPTGPNFHASGGGGGGGRIKIFSDIINPFHQFQTYVDGGTSNSGCPGSFGNLIGDPGTIYEGYHNFNTDTFNLGPETEIQSNLFSPIPDWICKNDSLQIIASFGFANHELYINGNQVPFNGNSQYINGLHSSDTITLRSYIGSNCFFKDTTFIVNVLPGPMVTLNSPTQTICHNASPVTLNAQPPGGIFTGANISNNTFSPALNPPNQYTITYQVTDTNNCTSADTITMEVLNCTGLDPLNKHVSFQITATSDGWILYENKTSDQLPVQLYSINGSFIQSMVLYPGNGKIWIGKLSKGLYLITGSGTVAASPMKLSIY